MIRRLTQRHPRVVVLVATIGIARLAQAIAIKIPQPSDRPAPTTRARSAARGRSPVSASGASDLAILIIVPVTVIASHLVPGPHDDRQDGEGVRQQPVAGAALSSISPKLVSTMVWALAAVLSTLSVILIAGESSTGGGTWRRSGRRPCPRPWSLRSSAGCARFGRTIIAAIAIGVLQSLVNLQLPGHARPINLLLFIAVFVAVIFNRERADEDRGVRLHPAGASHPGAPALVLVGPQHRQGRDPCCWRLIAVILPLVFTKPSTPAALHRGARPSRSAHRR